MPTTICNMGLQFKAVAAQHPKHVALAFADARIDYATLDALSDRAASHLLQAGVKTGQVVAIYAEKNPLTYAAMLGALKIGAPYVVLDTASPMARLEKILNTCQPALIVYDPPIAWNQTKTLPLSVLEADIQPVDAAVIAAVTPDTPSYIMFTSGSTGFPKGVTISHGSQLKFCDWTRRQFSITPDDVVTGVNPLYFDNSVFDFTASLFNGATLKAIVRDVVTQPKQLVEAVADCTVWFSVPSLLIYVMTLKALHAGAWPKMRAIIFGGEGFAKAELKKLYGMYGTQATLWNVYGPTETTCICSAHAVDETEASNTDKLAPLGHMADLFESAVVDAQGNEVLAGEVGELLLMGSQVALGYYNDPERTVASFTPYQGKACYHTGDLVWQDVRGHYHFSGRRDNQIKHMGYRIELEEIEAALNGMDGVVQSAVIYHRSARGGKIIAFVQAEGNGEDLKARLREVLPSYMIPESIEVRDSLPKNANGKVDRGALAVVYGETHD